MSTPTRARDLPAQLREPAHVGALLRTALADRSVIGFCWIVMALAPASWWPLHGLCIVLIAGRLHALGVVLHDACHLRRQPAPAQRRWLQLLAGYPITTTLAAMRYHHLRHHRNSCMAQDPYFKPGASDHWWPALRARLQGLLLPPAWIVRSFIGSAALHWPALRNGYARVLLGDRSGSDLRDDAELLECLRAEPGQALFFLLVAVVAWIYPIEVALGYLLPLMLAALLNANRVAAEHRHVLVHDREPATVVGVTRDHTGGWANRLLLYPHNIGYHVMHHLHPAVAWHNLPALQAWYREHTQGYEGP
jgi:fatty acid desaturase